MLRLVVAAGALLALPTLALAQDAEAGKKVFQKCAPCHSIGPGATNKVGPNLSGLVGRKAGTEEGFSYSDAMKNSGLDLGRGHLQGVHHRPQEEGPRQQDAVPGREGRA